MASVSETTRVSGVSAVAADTAVPTATQQSSFSAALANAQLGMTSSADASATADQASATHLALFSMFQQTVLRVMDEVDRNRKEAAATDD